MGDWWYAASKISSYGQSQIARWVLCQDWAPNTVFKKPRDYHVTLAYAYDGRGRADLPQRVASVQPLVTYEARTLPAQAFTDAQGSGLVPIVVPLHAPALKRHVEYHTNEFKRAGYKVSEFLEDGYTPHITVAMVDPIWDPAARVKRMDIPCFTITLEGKIITGGVKL